jgi:hypothetical protein
MPRPAEPSRSPEASAPAEPAGHAGRSAPADPSVDAGPADPADPAGPADRAGPAGPADPAGQPPLNRAERRAHARGGTPRVERKARDTGRHNADGGRRQWTTRRGGN